MINAIYKSMTYNNVSSDYFQVVADSFGNGSIGVLFHKATCSFAKGNYFESAAHVEELWLVMNEQTFHNPELCGLTYIQLKHLEGIVLFFIARSEYEKINALKKIFEAFKHASDLALKDQAYKINTTFKELSLPKGEAILRKRLPTYPF